MTKCKICGEEYSSIGKHIRTHNISAEEYYLRYIGDVGHCKVCDKKTKFHTLSDGFYSFCCKKCRDKYQTGITFRRKQYIKKSCMYCNKIFTIPPAGRNRKFCSRKCYAEYLKLVLVGENNPFYGKRHKEETLNKISGENNHGWNGGSSYIDYPKEFNNRLKEKIRKRDKFTCQECGYTQKQLGYTLHVHHIDYNKKNCNENNLISLCRTCHMKTNYNRNDWENYYREKLKYV